MSEHHHHNHNHHHHHDSTDKNLKLAFFLNFSFTLIEIIGGYLTGSFAILSDALHDLGDSLALGTAIYLEKHSEKKGNKIYSFGYGRLKIISALLNSIILFLGAVFIIYTAISEFNSPKEIHSVGMFGLALLGILVNGFAYIRLRNSGKNINVRMISLHLLEDTLGWIAVLIGSILIYFFKWNFIDSLLSIGISVYILYNVFFALKSIIRVLLQGLPENVSYDLIRDLLNHEKEILHIQDLHIWSLDGENAILSCHLVISQETDSAELKKSIKNQLSDFKIYHATIELNYSESEEHTEFKNCY